jgi:hypothetical protein
VCKVHRAGPDDAAALIGAGVALHECLTAANQPAEDGINARVIDLYSIKPIDAETLHRTCLETGAGSSSLKTTTPEVASAQPYSKPSPAKALPNPIPSYFQSTHCPLPAIPRDSSTLSASPRATSPPPPATP